MPESEIILKIVDPDEAKDREVVSKIADAILNQPPKDR